MRIAIFGAGAVGGLVAARLAADGADPALVARGETALALAARGLTLDHLGERVTTRPRIVTDTADAGPQDVVVLALKANQIAPALPAIRPLIGPETLIVPAINGVPWWYPEGLDGPLAGLRLTDLDPDGALAAALPASRIAGCVVYVAAAVPTPGEVKSQGLSRLELGAVTETPPPHLDAFAAALARAGFDAPVLADIRAAVWRKLWGNIWANPLSVATGATTAELTRDDEVRATAAAMMAETERIANALGVTFDTTIEARIGEAAKIGDFKTSMLQDYERGRPIELAAILGAAREIGDRLDIPTPTLDTVHALVRLRARLAGALD